MDAATTIAPNEQQDVAPQHVSSSERRCLLTGEVLPKSDLLRFVVGPGQILVPDLAQNLPGRGLWVKADYPSIVEASKKNVFSKAAKTAVKIPADVLEQIATLMRKRCLDFIGLAKRAGISILGQPQVEAALRADKLGLLLLASDAEPEIDSRATVPIIRFFTRAELGAALGFAQLVYVGFEHNPMTRKLRTEIDRLGKIMPDNHITSLTDSRTE